MYLLRTERKMNSSSNKSQPRRDSKPLVFIVDDEPLMLELAVTLLEPLACQVKTFRDAESALAAFGAANPRPALIITDYAMHRMNGLEFIGECKRLQPGQKIILMSGTVGASIYQDSPVKPDYFLAKPYQAKKFISLVEAALRTGGEK
jgi:CheY-like chemotaxis protein